MATSKTPKKTKSKSKRSKTKASANQAQVCQEKPGTLPTRIQTICSVSMAAITFGILVVTSLYTCFAKQQVGEMKRAVDLNERTIRVLEKQIEETASQFHSSNRPWLSISGDIKTVTPLSIKPRQPISKVEYRIRNGGKAPAFRQTIMAKTIIGDPNELISYAQKNDPCNNLGAMKALTSTIGLTILPGDEVLRTTDVSPPHTNPPLDKEVSVMSDICIQYIDEFGKLHYTGERWMYYDQEGKMAYFVNKPVQGQWKRLSLGTTAK